jgi:thiazolylpeptide-type bacteriocin precursor
MSQRTQSITLSDLRGDLEQLETETFEIQDHEEAIETLASGTTSCTSTTSSSTSTSGTSCCG